MTVLLSSYGPNSFVSAFLWAFVIGVIAAVIAKVWESIKYKEWSGIVKALVLGLALLALPFVIVAMIALSANRHGNY